MKLHEKIYTLRTEKGFSQGDLAELLDVSRQSVSKWETGASVPDLDKLVKMSDLFEVSMDFLVREEMPENEQKNTENPQKTDENGENPQNIVIVKEPISMRKMTGIILIVFAFVALLALTLGDEMEMGFAFAGILLGFAMICLISQKNVAYYLACYAYLLSKVLFVQGIEIPLSANSSLNLPIIPLIFFIPVTVWTLRKFQWVRFSPNLKQKILFFVSWLLFIVFPFGLDLFMKNAGEDMFLFFVWKIGYTVAFWILAVFTAAWIREIRKKKGCASNETT